VKDEQGKIVKWFGSFTDIHDQKLVAAELLESKERAEDAVKAKQQFLSHMSHEIRTPMNSIIGFTKVVLRTALEEKQREYVNAIKMSGDVLLVLINDILDLAKVDAGRMTFGKKPFKLADTVSAILHLFELRLQEKNIAVVKDFDPRIPEVLSGDPVRLHQVILNLMSNAVKFTKEGTISIGVKLLQEEGEKVTIKFSVADTGIGIAEDKLNLLFENFQQAHKGGEQFFGGTGLGLSIAKKLVEAQGGSMGVQSKLSVGSVFSFTLSFQKTNESPEIEEEEWMQGNTNQNSKILLVEDNALNQLLIKTLMGDFGFELDIVDNGKLAIEKLISNQQNSVKGYDIILMDLLMPEMDGFETSTYIRNELQLEIPIIALTANIAATGVRKCIEVGMNDYIAKPIDEKLLFNKINHWLKLPLGSREYRIPKGTASDSIHDKCIDLTYLKRRTKNDAALTAAMIRIYLKQTPELINAIKEGIEKKDWSLLYAAAHKLLPSFAIMGIDPRFEEITKKIQEYAGSPEDLLAVQENIASLEAICKQAIGELELELKKL
jgi:CheY-like chemotaxis protein/nitrogen-specific signal transduction histidine kinase